MGGSSHEDGPPLGLPRVAPTQVSLRPHTTALRRALDSLWG